GGRAQAPPWQGGILLLNTTAKLKGPGAASVCGRPQGPPGPSLWRSQHWVKAPPSNKEQTPPGDLLDPSPRFHGGCFGVWGTPPPKPFNCKFWSKRPGARLGDQRAHPI